MGNNNNVDSNSGARWGFFGAILAALITGAVALIVADKMPFTVTQTEQSKVALSETFDSTNGSYDTTLWNCERECSVENVFSKNSVLNLQRQEEGWSALLSNDVWHYEDVISLEGKFQISSKSDTSIGWLGLASSAGCDIDGFEGSPFIKCFYGPVENREYHSQEKPIRFDNWYAIKIEFGQESRQIRYFVDNILIGEFSPSAMPETAQIYLGIYSGSGVTHGLAYIDDIKLHLRK